MELSYKLEMFEGPLDLLLSLISKNKIDIDDIPIFLLCDQYMDYLDKAEKFDIELSSDFIVMASELMLIKSRMLLPRNEEEEEDPREDLAQRLLEYQRYKEASKELRRSEFWSQYMFFKGSEKISFPIPPYSKHHETQELIDAFNSILQRKIRKEKPKKRAFAGIVGREKVSVEDMVEKVCKLLSNLKDQPIVR